MRLLRRRPSGSLILLYHRVALLERDPQLLAVTPAHFAEHLEVLRRHAIGTPLRRIAGESGDEGRPRVAITFDDGYADNLHEALPLLEDAQLHATFFVVSGAVGSAREFWWDDVERLLLDDAGVPTRLDLTIDGTAHRFELSGPRPDAKDWNVLRGETPSSRHEAYRTLMATLHRLGPSARNAALEELRIWAGSASEGRASHRPLDEGELRRLADSEAAEIGAHTVSHPSLAALSPTQQRDEVRGSKARLEEILGRPVTTFSYPFGGPSEYTDETVRAVAETGFELACANVEGKVGPAVDPFQLPRFLVRDWDGREFERRLRAWLRLEG
jgi:peptidoglycan/xylan/chitin deacetylase (PgdA/CDA1 family)